MKKITGVNILDDDIKDKLTTRSIYEIFNKFVIPLITKEEQEFLEELEDFLIKKIEPKINLNEEVYDLFPILGEKNWQ